MMGKKLRKNSFVEKRVGMSRLNNSGERMTLIAYRNCKDIDVQFEDGTIRSGICYHCFMSGNVGRVKEQLSPSHLQKIRETKLRNAEKKHIGQSRLNNKGQMMIIIAYHPPRSVDVQFEDGTVKKSVRIDAFYKGSVRKPNSSIDCESNTILIDPLTGKKLRKSSFAEKRVGMTNMNCEGERMTLIAYRNYNDVDVQFEDGTVCSGTRYCYFKFGTLKNTNGQTGLNHSRMRQHTILDQYKKKYIGMSKLNNKGKKMTIIAYHSY